MSFHTVSDNTAPTCVLFGLLALGTLLGPSSAWSQLVPGSMDVHWNEGASDCTRNPQPPLQIHRYNARTFVLRENLCATLEAPFIYLLVGSTKALLIDTGAVADPIRMPLAKTVMSLLPGDDSTKPPLLVVHTHRHLDHRAGDGQFVHLPHVQVVGFDLDSVRHYYNFTDWPNGVAEIDLGNRTVDVIPTPGHNETEISFYDRNTGLFLSGDFLLPSRLLIDDSRADLASALRAVAFVKDRPVSFVLGGHIEMDTQGNLFRWGSQYHPHEHVLQLTKEDLFALPAALREFNGFYTVTGHFIMSNPIHNIIALAILAAVVLIALGLLLARYIRRRRRVREQKNSFAG
jgi:hydroxyacylglutathione hydrolase